MLQGRQTLPNGCNQKCDIVGERIRFVEAGGAPEKNSAVGAKKMRPEGRVSNGMSEVELVERLREHQELKERFEELLGVVENAKGDAVKADEAEERITQELRKLGQSALQGWADRKNERVTVEAERRSDTAHKEKKTSTGTADMDELK